MNTLLLGAQCSLSRWVGCYCNIEPVQTSNHSNLRIARVLISLWAWINPVWFHCEHDYGTVPVWIKWISARWCLCGLVENRFWNAFTSFVCTMKPLRLVRYTIVQSFYWSKNKKALRLRLDCLWLMVFHYRVASSSGSSGINNSRTKSLSTTHNLTCMAAFLTELADEFDLSVVAMNHLTTRIDKDDNSNNRGGTTKLVPSLGESDLGAFCYITVDDWSASISCGRNGFGWKYTHQQHGWSTQLHVGQVTAQTYRNGIVYGYWQGNSRYISSVFANSITSCNETRKAELKLQ